MPKSTEAVCCETCPYFHFLQEHSIDQQAPGDGPCFRLPGPVKNENFVQKNHVCGEHPLFDIITIDYYGTSGEIRVDEMLRDRAKKDIKTDPA